jgi:alpha-glucosidase (family GH31 glycosyl hydrolase)
VSPALDSNLPGSQTTLISAMPQQEVIPHGWVEVDSGSPTKVILKSEEIDGQAWEFSLEVLSPTTCRSTFTSASHPLPPFPACPVPEPSLRLEDIETTRTKTSRTITIEDISQVRVDWEKTPVVSLTLLYEGENDPKIIHADLPFRSYAIDGTGVAHYTTYDASHLHCGLGEKAAPFDLSGRNFRLAATDSFGYDAYKSDPLYKHIPLLISASPDGVVAQFSTSHSRGRVSIGGEMDGLWGKYKVFRQDFGGLEEYLILAPSLKDLVKSYGELVGFPQLVPRWALGYIAGGMKYSMLDDPPAHEALKEFAAKLREEDIPCSAFQLSSGYTVAETEPKTRNVFTWNKHRFPSPEAFVQGFRTNGIRVLANIKPYVLKNHPEYENLKANGALFTDPRTDEAAVTRLWSAGGGESGEGSHIDFSSKAGFEWWFKGVRGLKEIGIDGIWNDNNEYTIPDDRWRMKLDLFVGDAKPTAEDAPLAHVVTDDRTPYADDEETEENEDGEDGDDADDENEDGDPGDEDEQEEEPGNSEDATQKEVESPKETEEQALHVVESSLGSDVQSHQPEIEGANAQEEDTKDEAEGSPNDGEPINEVQKLSVSDKDASAGKTVELTPEPKEETDTPKTSKSIESPSELEIGEGATVGGEAKDGNDDDDDDDEEDEEEGHEQGVRLPESPGLVAQPKADSSDDSDTALGSDSSDSSDDEEENGDENDVLDHGQEKQQSEEVVLPWEEPIPKVRRIEDPGVGVWGRAIHAELMAKASRAAVLDVNPEERPYILTRSATVGTMQHACSSWSGDNVTSWESMKASTALSLNAGLSLLSVSFYYLAISSPPR